MPHPDQHEPAEDLQAACKFLIQFEHSWRLEFPGDAPAFHAPAASWAATMLYRAAQAAVYREIPEPILCDGLSLECPSTPDGAARHYSVDLVFRFLPDLAVLARHASPDDPLLKVLQTWANQWPLSSVGMKGAEPVALDAIASHGGLLQLYVDRILARQDFSRLADPRGPFDIRKLRHGELVTNTEGMLPEASVAFLDELLNANSAILDSLRTGLSSAYAPTDFLTAVCTEDLARLGEPRQQVIEDVSLNAAGQLMDDGAFGRARRAKDEQFFAADQADSQQVDDLMSIWCGDCGGLASPSLTGAPSSCSASLPPAVCCVAA